MSPIEIAVYALMLAGGNEPLVCTREPERIVCDHGRTAAMVDGRIRFDDGVEVLKLVDGSLAFSNGITTHFGSAGWVKFSNGLSVRRQSDGSFKFSTGLLCRAVTDDKAVCAKP